MKKINYLGIIILNLFSFFMVTGVNSAYRLGSGYLIMETNSLFDKNDLKPLWEECLDKPLSDIYGDNYSDFSKSLISLYDISENGDGMGCLTYTISLNGSEVYYYNDVIANNYYKIVREDNEASPYFGYYFGFFLNPSTCIYEPVKAKNKTALIQQLDNLIYPDSNNLTVIRQSFDKEEFIFDIYAGTRVQNPYTGDKDCDDTKHIECIKIAAYFPSDE